MRKGFGRELELLLIQKGERIMGAADNKAILQQLGEEIGNKGDLLL